MSKLPQVFTDRYQVTGTPYPTKDSCDWCDGMGISPLHKSEENKNACKTSHGKLVIVGQKEKDGSPCEDNDYFFVKCPECFGTRKKNSTNDEKISKLLSMFNLTKDK